MMSFADKIRDARNELRLTQHQLGEKVGVSVRSILAYERGEKRPRQAMLLKLAKALNVSTKYLTDDTCTDPQADIEMDDYIEEAHGLYGMDGVRDINNLLAQNQALFAGGELSQDQKDAFFQAVMEAYVLCKEGAKETYGRKKTK